MFEYHASILKPQQFPSRCSDWIVTVGLHPSCETSYKNIALSLFLSHFSTRGFEEEPILSIRAKTLLYLQYGKTQTSILSVSQTKELITDTGNREHGLFSNLPEPLPITSCVKTYETCEVDLCCLLLLADIIRRKT